MELTKHEQPLLVGGVFDEFPYDSRLRKTRGIPPFVAWENR